MRARAHLAALAAAAALLSCGDSATVNVDIEIASNSGGVMQLLKQAYDAGNSQGLYVRFDALKPCPADVNDVDVAVAPVLPSDPARMELGADPSKGQIVINTSDLSADRVYRVRVLASIRNGTTVTSYSGDASCPMSTKYPDLNPLVVCFGTAVSPGVCATSPNFLLDCNLTPEQSQNCN